MNTPEVNIARKIVERHKLVPPIDIFSLTRTYADLYETNLPAGLDGVSIDLKVEVGLPTVYLHKAAPRKRKRFTCAHELGHVIIPWHIGSFVDDFESGQVIETDEYWVYEKEANVFAAELLMPDQWIRRIISDADSHEDRISSLIDDADVSLDAARIRLFEYLPPGIIGLELDSEETVLWSQRTEGTFAQTPMRQTQIDLDGIYTSCEHFEEFHIRNRRLVFFDFAAGLKVPVLQNSLNWRELLHIVYDRHRPENDFAKFRSRLNGLLSFVNSRLRSSDSNEVYMGMAQRMASDDAYPELMDDPDFLQLLLIRAHEFSGKW